MNRLLQQRPCEKSMSHPRVMIGLLGTSLDQVPRRAKDRWTEWRPTVAVRRTRHTVSTGTPGSPIAAQVGDRKARCTVQSIDRTHRTGHARDRGTDLAHGSDRQRQDATRQTDLPTQATASTRCRRARRSQLRHDPWRAIDVDIVWSREGCLHGSDRAARWLAQSG